MPPKCSTCGYYHGQHNPCPPDPAQSAPSAEPCKVTGGLGGKFYLSPDGNWIIWDNKPPEYADEAHRGLFYALKAAETRAETAEKRVKELEEIINRDK